MDNSSRKLSLLLWLAWALAFCILEAVGLSGAPGWPTLTRVVRRYMPASLTLGFVAWLFAHFVETYQNPPEI